MSSRDQQTPCVRLPGVEPGLAGWKPAVLPKHFNHMTRAATLEFYLALFAQLGRASGEDQVMDVVTGQVQQLRESLVVVLLVLEDVGHLALVPGDVAVRGDRVLLAVRCERQPGSVLADDGEVGDGRVQVGGVRSVVLGGCPSLGHLAGCERHFASFVGIVHGARPASVPRLPPGQTVIYPGFEPGLDRPSTCCLYRWASRSSSQQVA